MHPTLWVSPSRTALALRQLCGDWTRRASTPAAALTFAPTAPHSASVGGERRSGYIASRSCMRRMWLLIQSASTIARISQLRLPQLQPCPVSRW